jgi:predicted outer membrane repeat protein
MQQMLHSKFAWNDHFSGTPEATFARTKYNSRQIPSGSSVYVSDCLFSSFTSSSNGGALYCSTSITFLLIESSSFFSCKTSSSNGGAIYFTNTNSGQCVLHEVCGFDCISTFTSSTSYGQFARVDVNNGVTSKNYVIYSSIVRCVSDYTDPYDALCLYYGKIYCPSINSSMNKCRLYSGIRCLPFSDSSSVTCSLLYSSFSDNKASYSICIRFDRTGANSEIKYCNIIRNTQVELNTNGMIKSSGNLTIENSCILENAATYIFRSTSSYTITLSNCTVDVTNHYNSLIIKNTVTKSFILGLDHMSTQNCHSEYDKAGYLTAIPYISHTTKKELCYCNTCKIIFYQARISVLFSLIWVFLFIFIHPNP